MEFSKKHILITGAGSGLGQELAREFLERGSSVIAVDKDITKLELLREKFGSTLEAIQMDLTNPNQLEKLTETIRVRGLQPDVLINNAGIIQRFVKVSELSELEIRKVFEVNFFAPLKLIKLFIPILLESRSPLIVNISSMGAYTPVPGQSIYGASKAALKLFSEGLDMELRDSVIRVALIFPGAMQTAIAQNSGISISPEMMKESQNYASMPANDAARQIIKCLERGRSRIYIGKDAKLMNLMNRISPTIAANLIYSKMKNLLTK